MLKESTTVKAATFSKKQQMGEVLELPVRWNKATAKPILHRTGQEHLLVNGLQGSLRQSDFEWCTWNNLDEVSFTIDLLQPEEIHRVAVRALTNYGMSVHKPGSVTVEVSADNVHFASYGHKTYTQEEVFTEGNFVDEISFDAKEVKARYVRISATAAGVNPPSHVRPGQPSRYYFDEVIVE